MKKKVLFSLCILFFISIIVLISYKKPNSKAQDVNRDYFNEIANINIDEIEGIEIIYHHGERVFDKIIKDNNDKKSIIDLINSLNLNTMEGNKCTNTNQVLYEIIISEKGYYPPGAIIISEHSVYFRDKEYYFNDDIGKKFKDLFAKL